jgi:hypothetical protein
MTMLKHRLILAALTILSSIPAATDIAAAQSATLFAVLNGANECNGATPPLCGQGDRNGAGAASVMLLGPRELCATIIVSGIGEPTAAHIHPGEAGVNGPPVVTLRTPARGNPGGSTFCTDTAPAGLTASIRNAPQNFYINLHNNAFPSGAVRGQLF